jgi:hypothetical protein
MSLFTNGGGRGYVQVEVLQVDEISDLSWDGTAELVGLELEHRQIHKISYRSWQRASEVARRQTELRDSASRRVAHDVLRECPRRRWVARVRVVPRRPHPALITPVGPSRLLPQIAQCLHRRLRHRAEGTRRGSGQNEQGGERRDGRTSHTMHARVQVKSRLHTQTPFGIDPKLPMARLDDNQLDVTVWRKPRCRDCPTRSRAVRTEGCGVVQQKSTRSNAGPELFATAD